MTPCSPTGWAALSRSGKSMEMELYTNLVTRHPKLKNPTVVVITDRTELAFNTL